jgi:uncharacterized membrane protein YagU involved in acid resistance
MKHLELNFVHIVMCYMTVLQSVMGSIYKWGSHKIVLPRAIVAILICVSTVYDVHTMKPPNVEFLRTHPCH